MIYFQTCIIYISFYFFRSLDMQTFELLRGNTGNIEIIFG